jgi:hypothetical protein
MTINGWLGKAGRVLRRCWTSVAAGGIAVIVIALFPLPAEGQSALVDIAGAGLGGEILEKAIRLSILGLYRGIRRARGSHSASASSSETPEGGA